MFDISVTTSLTTPFTSFCYIGIFGPSCIGVTPTFTEDAYAGTGVTTTVELLSDTFVQIALPTITVTPAGCLSVSWQAAKTVDSTDMVASKPAVYAISAASLDISHVVTDFLLRRDLFGTLSLHFQGTVSDSPPSSTSPFPFVVDFVDACRTATVVGQAITFSPVAWNVDLTASLSVPAFTDSVDSTGTYTAGIFGVKTFALDAATPSFLTLSPGADQLVDAYTIDYDQTAATESDIGVHTIDYTVTITEYTGIATVLASTFTFEI